MGAALPHFCFLDRGSAKRTGLVFLLINLKIVLEFSPAVDPIDAGAFLVNPFA